MRFALMSEPQQGLTYDEILALARAAEAAGFEAYFRSDHYGSFPGAAGRPTTDAWATLAGLARDTSRIRLGTLVSPVTFRLPGNLAKVVATVDEMSGGRVELGHRCGLERAKEHAAHGFPFPSLGERYDMLEETLAIIHGLWAEPDGWTYEGRHWQVRGAAFRASPARAARRHPPTHPRRRRWASIRGPGGALRGRGQLASATPDRVRGAYERSGRPASRRAAIRTSSRIRPWSACWSPKRAGTSRIEDPPPAEPRPRRVTGATRRRGWRSVAGGG